MPDYENDLAFKPAMSWEDLCEWVKDNYKEVFISKSFISFWNKKWLSVLRFYKAGLVSAENNNFESDNLEFTIAENVSYERMKTIIEALWG